MRLNSLSIVFIGDLGNLGNIFWGLSAGTGYGDGNGLWGLLTVSHSHSHSS